MSQTEVTYMHLIAGSVVHFQKKKASKDADAEPCKTLTFYGKKGGVGFYTTSDADEIAELDKLASNPQVQIERVAAATGIPAGEVAMTKPVAPELVEVVQEVQERAAIVSSPEVISAQEKLAATIAASKK